MWREPVPGPQTPCSAVYVLISQAVKPDYTPFSDTIASWKYSHRTMDKDVVDL